MSGVMVRGWSYCSIKLMSLDVKLTSKNLQRRKGSDRNGKNLKAIRLTFSPSTDLVSHSDFGLLDR